MTVTCSNYEEVRRYYDTPGTAFYGTAIRPTEMLHIDPDCLEISALRITAPYVEVTLLLKFST